MEPRTLAFVASAQASLSSRPNAKARDMGSIRRSDTRFSQLILFVIDNQWFCILTGKAKHESHLT